MNREDIIRMAREAGLSHMPGWVESGWGYDNLERFAALVAAAALAEPVQGCPSCEYNKQRAQLWRNEAYKLGGHPLDWEPELMVRPKPLTEEEIKRIDDSTHFHESPDWSLRFARAIERAHGIGEKE